MQHPLVRGILKVCGWLLGVFAAVAFAAVVYVYVASELVIARTYDVPLSGLEASRDSAAIAEGKRLATLVGCTGCHGAQLTGTIMFDEPGIARFAAPNVTRIAREYSDAELERLIRHGVKRDGRSLWIMPSAMYSHMTDEHVSALIAYVRSVPERDGVDREVVVRPVGRFGIVIGRFKPTAAEIERNVERQAPDRADPLSHGRYLVMNACSECHGQRLQGSDMVKAPGLLISAAYSEADLAKLLRTGVALGDRKLGLMSRSAARFASLSDDEVHAIRTYLSAFVQQGGTAPP